MKKKCLECGKEFVTYEHLVRVGKGKFCSRECGYKGGSRKSNSGSFKKGEHRSCKTEFKKGEQLGSNHPLWNGGRYKISNGYIWTYAPKHPRAYRNGVYEHIIVAEEKLGRHLIKGECVHHINGIKDDNRPENIITFPSNGEHMSNHLKGRKRQGKGGKWQP